MTITITGLTKQQYQIADMIWSCESQEAVDQLMRALPVEYKQDAKTVHELMIAAVMDQHEDITEDVKELIHSISRS
jgi:urease gamma subunit